jgi:general secretion pathway protein H
MSRIGSVDVRRVSSGFMLLDLALALTILLLLFAIAWPAIGNGTNNAQQLATAYDIASLLRVDRSLAASDGRLRGTRINLTARTVTGTTGRLVYIPRDLAVEVTTAQECMEGTQSFVIIFAPNGSSCGGVILLRKNGRAYAVRINWLTGMVDVVKIPKA